MDASLSVQTPTTFNVRAWVQGFVFRVKKNQTGECLSRTCEGLPHSLLFYGVSAVIASPSCPDGAHLHFCVTNRHATTNSKHYTIKSWGLGSGSSVFWGSKAHTLQGSLGRTG